MDAITTIAISFNYDALDTGIACDLRDKAQRIRARIAKTVEDAFAVGDELLATKNSIDRDEFKTWIETELGISWATAYRWMNLARRKSEFLSLRNLTLDLAYTLMSKDATPEIVAGVVAKVEAGEVVPIPAVKGMISDLRYERRREEEQQRRAKRRKGKTTELQRRRPDAAAAADVEAKRARAAARNLVDELGVDVVWRVLEVSHDYAILRELRKEIEEFDAAEAR
jgi:hypothetical protein